MSTQPRVPGAKDCDSGVMALCRIQYNGVRYHYKLKVDLFILSHTPIMLWP